MKKKELKKIALPHLSLRLILIILGCLLLPVMWYFFFGPLPIYDRGLASIDDLVAYNKTIDEFVKMDNTDLLHPSYDSYYKKHFESGFFDRLKKRCVGVMVKCGIASPPPFSYGFLKKLLEENTKAREAQSFKGLHVVKFNIEPDTKIIVVGVLQGAIHSFTRSLLKMQELGLMTKDFKLTNPKHVLFFLGNVINRTPYTSEIFMVGLKIMLQNPKQVFYMRGGQEFNATWMKYSLRQELEMGAQRFSQGKDSIPLMAEVDAFFNTLPLEAYGLITAKKTAEEIPYIVLSAHIEDKDLVKRTNEKEYFYFIRGNDSVLDLDKVVKKPGDAEEKPRPVAKATVRDIRKRSSYEQMDGLRALPPEEDATAWTVFSSPNASYRTGLKFIYDAFAVITPADAYSDWKIALYSRNMESKDAAFTTRQEAFLVGASSNGKPVEKAGEKKSEKAVEKASEKATEKAAGKPEVKSEKGAEKPINEKIEKKAEAGAEKPIEKPVDKVVEKPVEKTVTASDQKVIHEEAKQISTAQLANQETLKKKKSVAKAVKTKKPELSEEETGSSDEEDDDVENIKIKNKKGKKSAGTIVETRIIEKTKIVEHPSVSQAQLAFYKELVGQVKALKTEVTEIRGTILKELQKFEIPESAQKTIEQDAKKNDKALSKPGSPAEQEKKHTLDASATQSSKLEESINQALLEVKKYRPEITIYNQVGQQGEAKATEAKNKSTAEVKEINALSDKGLEALVVMVNTLKEELKQQRMLTQKALAEK